MSRAGLGIQAVKDKVGGTRPYIKIIKSGAGARSSDG